MYLCLDRFAPSGVGGVFSTMETARRLISYFHLLNSYGIEHTTYAEFVQHLKSSGDNIRGKRRPIGSQPFSSPVISLLLSSEFASSPLSRAFDPLLPPNASSPTVFQDYVERHEELARVFEQFNKILLEERAIDFTTLPGILLRQLKRRPAALSESKL